MFNHGEFNIDGFYKYIFREIIRLKIESKHDPSLHPDEAARQLESFKQTLFSWKHPKDENTLEDKIEQLILQHQKESRNIFLDPKERTRKKLIILLDFCYAHSYNSKSLGAALKPIIKEMVTILLQLNDEIQDQLAPLLAKWNGYKLFHKYFLGTTYYEFILSESSVPVLRLYNENNIVYLLEYSLNFAFRKQEPRKDEGSPIRLAGPEKVVSLLKDNYSQAVNEKKELEGQIRSDCFSFFKRNNKPLQVAQKKLNKIEHYALTHEWARQSFKDVLQHHQPQQDKYHDLYKQLNLIINELDTPSALTHYESRRELINDFNRQVVNINNDGSSSLEKIADLANEMIKLSYKMVLDDKQAHPRDLIKANKANEIIKKAFKLLNDAPESQHHGYRQEIATVHIRNEYFRWHKVYAKKLKSFGPFHSRERRQQAKALLDLLKPPLGDGDVKHKGDFIKNNINKSANELKVDNMNIYNHVTHCLFAMKKEDQTKSWLFRSNRGFNNLRSIMEEMVHDYEKQIHKHCLLI